MCGTVNKMRPTDYDNNRFEKMFKMCTSHLKPVNHFIKLASYIIILLMVIELTLFIVVEARDSMKSDDDKIDPRINIDVYPNKSIARNYFIEFDGSAEGEYAAYLGYRRMPNYTGEYINIDERSVRNTVNECRNSHGMLKIFVFGGSTMWGDGVTDEGTIPSLLSNELCGNNISVEVTNFGESGYVSTQEMIKLQLELRNGNTPDIVIFYDGINDIYSALENNEAGLPRNLKNRKDDFNSRDRLNLAEAFPLSRKMLYRISRILNKDKNQRGNDIDPQLINETATIYLSNVKLIKSLESEYNFKSFFYWQPSIITKTTLSEDEKTKIRKSNQPVEFIYIPVSREVVKSEDVRDLTDVFRDYNSSLYIDWMHISENGNEIIAKEIANDIQNYLNNSG